MRRPYYPWSLRALLGGRPDLGSLLDLCDENYHLLLRLAPDLGRLRDRHLSRAADGVELLLSVRGQTPFTSLIELTYHFEEGGERVADPAALLRVYHDARQVEVLELRQQVLPLDRHPDMGSLERKWRLNLFLSKWLAYCCQHHRFGPVPEPVSAEPLLCP